MYGLEYKLGVCCCNVCTGLLFFTCLFYVASFVVVVLFYVYYAHAVSKLLAIYVYKIIIFLFIF